MPWLFGMLCELFAIELVVRVNPDALKRMEKRWEQRDLNQIRLPHAISKTLLDRCRPVILAELGYVGEPNGKVNGHNGYKG